MTMGPHERAQELATRAGAAAATRRRHEARRLYSDAADLERLALAEVPTDKPRTRSILSVSYVSLLFKAARYDDAAQAAYRALSRDDLLPFGREQLRELLEVVFDEQSIPEGYEYSGDEVIITLRGGEVGYGSAPFDLVLQKGNDFKSYMTRVVEYDGKFPFRTNGPAPGEVANALNTRATQPVASSYKFSLRIVGPKQTDLFEEPRIKPAAAVAAAMAIVRLANIGTQKAHAELVEVVPDAAYRGAMLRLVRNLASTDGGLRELELARRDSEEQQVETVLLGPGSADRVRGLIHFERKETPAELNAAITIEGVLRAVHLDKQWLEVVPADGSPVARFRTKPDVLDDVVGPMVNRRVIVRAHERNAIKGKPRYDLIDIEIAHD